VPYDLSDPEAALYEQVTTYVREEMNRADRLKAKGEGRRGTIVGFALTVLQRRLASSPAAIHMSIRRRLARLERTLAEAEVARQGDLYRTGRLTNDISALDRRSGAHPQWFLAAAVGSLTGGLVNGEGDGPVRRGICNRPDPPQRARVEHLGRSDWIYQVLAGPCPSGVPSQSARRYHSARRRDVQVTGSADRGEPGVGGGWFV